MTRIGELLESGPTLSYEFFPPKTDKAQRDLEKTLQELAPTSPDFVSVTYGALGSTRDRTHDIVNHIHTDMGMVVMPHLTCVGHTRAEVVQLLEQYRDEGIENVLALGGDPPKDPTAQQGEFRYASELVEVIRHVGDFSVGVAAFPEVHPRSSDRAADRRHLMTKLEKADFAITQFFFDPEPFLRLRDELAAHGCTTPILPGVLPVANVEGAKRMSAMNGATFPEWLEQRLSKAGSDEAVVSIGTECATELATRLLAEGVPGLHLYTLNRSGPAREIVAATGLRSGGFGPGGAE
jgi:methylenetetrahydrofolate reductase (NADPH)